MRKDGRKLDCRSGNGYAPASVGNFDPINSTWTIPSLNPGVQASLVITTTVTRAGRFSNIAGVISVTETDPVPGNNVGIANIVVSEVTIQSMIQNLMTKVTAFEQQGLMTRYPAADLSLTLMRALNYVNMSNPNEAIRQL